MDQRLADIQTDLFWVSASVRQLNRPDVLALHSADAAPLTNQVIRTTAPNADIPGLIEEIQVFHPAFSRWLVVPPFRAQALEANLPRFGYTPSFEGDGFTVETAKRWAVGDFRATRVHNLDTLRDNLWVAQQGFGRGPRTFDFARQLAMCTGPAARTARFVAYTADGEPVASGNLNRYPDAGFGLLWAGCTVPAWRGRGAYRALLSARSEWAHHHGLTHIGLYAKRDTSGPVVRRLGFNQHGPMAYWERRTP